MKFRILQSDRKEVKRYFCKTQKEMQLTSESSSLDTSCTSGQVHKKLRNLKSTQTAHKKGGMNWQNKLRMCILYTNIKSRKDSNNSKKGALKKGVENMHFDAIGPFKKMMMDLISSADDIVYSQRIF